MSASTFKSSHTPPKPGKIDPDRWVSSKDASLSLQGRVTDERWVETILWNQHAPKAVGTFIHTVIDLQTGKSATASDKFATIAMNKAKALIGMP